MTQFLNDIQKKFWEQVEKTPTCWLWTGLVNSNGYGTFGNYWTKESLAHRLVWIWEYGPIPDGLWIDHVRARGCASRLCVRPTHLEAVTPRENLLRGNTIPARYAARTHCINDHEFTEENTLMMGNTRVCRTCNRNRARERRLRLKQR